MVIHAKFFYGNTFFSLYGLSLNNMQGIANVKLSYMPLDFLNSQLMWPYLDL